LRGCLLRRGLPARRRIAGWRFRRSVDRSFDQLHLCLPGVTLAQPEQGGLAFQQAGQRGVAVVLVAEAGFVLAHDLTDAADAGPAGFLIGGRADALRQQFEYLCVRLTGARATRRFRGPYRRCSRGSGRSRAPALRCGRLRSRRGVHVVGEHEFLARALEGQGCGATADTHHEQAAFLNASRQRREVGVARHDAEAVDQAGVKQVHRVDDHGAVGGVLAADDAELLERPDRVIEQVRLPAGHVGRGPVAVDAAHGDPPA
jgi:hypothetical protein